MIGAESVPSNDYNMLSLVIMAAVAAGGFFTAWVTRRNSTDNTAASDRATGVQEFKVVGDLAEQLAERMYERTREVQEQERHECDEKIEALRTELHESIAECHTERETFRSLLIEQGLLPD